MCKFIITIMLILMPTISYSDPIVIKDWAVDVGDEKSFIYAVSMNDSGSLFGQYCFMKSGNCVYVIGLDTSCEKGHKYTSLANSDIGSAVFELYCDDKIQNNTYRYYFTDFDAIDKLAKSSKKVGFAIPLEDDQFRVVRFKLNGGDTAISYMRTIAEKMTDAGKSNKNKNSDEYY